MRFTNLLPLAAVAGVALASPTTIGTTPDQEVLNQGAEPIAAAAKASTKSLLQLHKDLITIDSVSYNELEVSTWLSAYLSSHGYTTELQTIAPNRSNVLAWPGSVRNAPLLISSHIDTVPPYYPYAVTKNSTTGENIISGRGAVDAKASVAAQILAVDALLHAHRVSPDDLALLFVVGEEVAGDGMRAANALNLTPRAIIFGEPTEGKLVSGHKGMLSFSLSARGKAAHSGYPWLGRSANEVLVSALAALMDLEQRLPASDKYGRTTINLGRIEGGVAGNVVAENASAAITVRIASGTPDFVRAQVEGAVRNATARFMVDDGDEVVEFDFSSRAYAPVDIDADVPGFESMTVNYGTDIPNLDPVEGQKRYLYGPGSIMVAHSDHEAIEVGTLVGAVEDYQKLILHALGE